MPQQEVSYNRKVIGVLASLFLVGRQQDLITRPVTLDIPVQSAYQALNQISRQTGVSMNAIGNVGTEIVFLKVQNRPLKEVMDKLAGVVKAEWRIETNGCYTLIRPQSIVEKENEKQISKQVRLLSKWLGKQTENLQAPFDPDGIRAIGYRRLRKVSYEDWNDNSPNDDIQDPVYRAFSRCLKNIDLREVAMLPSNGQVVYSTMPTKVQRRLPTNVVPELVAEQAVWSKQMNAIKWQDESGKVVEAFGGYSENDPVIRSAFGTRHSFPGEPYLATVMVRRSEYNTLQFMFDVLDQNGKEIISLTELGSIDEETPDTPKSDSSVPALQLPQAETQTLSFWGEGESKSSGTKEYLKFGLNATKFDGLLAGNQELMTALANQTGKAVIACIPDDGIIQGYVDFEFDRYFQKVPERWSQQTSAKWIELYPENYATHWRTRLTRSRLSKCVYGFSSSREFNLRNYAHVFCGELGYITKPEVSSISTRCLNLLGLEGTPELSSNPNFLHLFASLSDDQMNRLYRGQIIPYRQLSSLQRELAKGIVFGQPGHFLVGGEATTDFGRFDATFELPNGLDDGPGIGLEVVDDDICVASEPDGSRFTHEVNLSKRTEEYIALEGMCGTRRSGPHKGMLFEFRKQKRMTLRCYLSPTHWFADDFTEGIRKTDGLVRPFKNLPQAFKSAINGNPEFEDAVVHREKLLGMKNRMLKLLENEKMTEDIAKSIRETIKQIDEYLSSMDQND
jgi:hypothetical protein